MTPHIHKILEFQGNHKIALLNAGLSEEKAEELSSEIIQNFLDSDLLSEEVRTEIKHYIS